MNCNEEKHITYTPDQHITLYMDDTMTHMPAWSLACTGFDLRPAEGSFYRSLIKVPSLAGFCADLTVPVRRESIVLWDPKFNHVPGLSLRLENKNDRFAFRVHFSIPDISFPFGNGMGSPWSLTRFS